MTNHTISFTVNGTPPKKSTGPFWGNKDVKNIINLRKKALEARNELELEGPLKGPVKLELKVHAENIFNRKDTSDYVGDLDSLIAGVMESLQAAPTTDKTIKINPLLKENNEIN